MVNRKSPPFAVSTDFLDGCRGLAALYVVFSHARYLLAKGNVDGLNAHPELYSAWEKSQFYFYSLFSKGHHAVIFFFVLSGFVIHLRYAKSLRKDPSGTKMEWTTYAYRRARRLFPPLLLAIALTYALDTFGLWQGFPIYLGHTSSPLLNNTIKPDHSLATLLGNLGFFQECYVPDWGTDGPLWSLHYEWWFYMFYPAFFLLSRRSMALAAGVMGACLAATLVPVRHPHVMELFFRVFQMMPIWWFGAILADVYAGRIRIPMKYVACLTILLPMGLLKDTLLSKLVLGLGFSGLIALGFEYQRLVGKLKVLDGLKWLGEMSYTLYVTHFPLLVCLGGWVMSRAVDRELPRHFGYASLGILAAMALAYALHFLVERPFLPKSRRSEIHPHKPSDQPPAIAAETAMASEPKQTGG